MDFNKLKIAGMDIFQMLHLDKTYYEQKVEKSFEDLIETSFLAYKPFEKSDSEIIEDAKLRYNKDSTYSDSFISRFCSIVKVSDIKEHTYNSRDFKKVYFADLNGKEAFSVKYSQFVWPMSIDTCEVLTYSGKFNTNKASVSTVEDRFIEPQSWENNIGIEILYGYSYQGVNEYNKLQKCFRFYLLGDTDFQTAEIIRKQILRAQAFTLDVTLHYPATNQVVLSNIGICQDTMDITRNIFESFRERYNFRFQEVVAELKKNGWSYETNII